MDVRILGGLEVLQDGIQVDLGPPRQRVLLARLLLNPGEVVTTDRLVEDLWPGNVPETARHALHVYVSKLRASLGPDRDRLTRRNTGYRLSIEPDELDASRFVAQVAEGRASLDRGDPETAHAQLESALDMWRGPVLADIADEEFVRAETVRLNEVHLVALEQRVAAALELGRHDALVEELRDLTVKHPFRERFWEQLMLALYRCGRQAEALRAFQTARSQLAEELGIEPGPALRRLEEQILTQDPILDLSNAPDPGTAPNNLPLLRTSFIGRRQELEVGSELLAGSRLLTLTGPPGSGKTRMAIRLASDHVGDFPHGTFFVPLAAVTDVHLISTTIARTLGLREVPGEEPVDSLKAFLRERRALLVLDNFEQIIEGAPLISELLDAAPDIKIVVSSRSPLELTGEQEFPVSPLAVPATGESLDPADVQNYDGVALFVTRARGSDPSFELDSSNAETISLTTARLDGLPLAIELAAARIRMLSPQDLLDRLDQSLTVLTGGPADATSRHRTLRDAIAWSYDLLQPDEQILFRRLGVFRGFTFEAAAGVTGLPEETVFAGIDSLLSKSLIYRHVDIGETRFAMLETLREYALEQLDGAREREEFAGCHATYFCKLAEASEPELTTEGQHAATQMLTQELANIRSALHYALETEDPDLGLLLAGCIWRFWQSSGHLAEPIRWMEALLASERASDPARAKGLTGLAGLAYWQGDYAKALGRYEEVLDIFRGLGDRHGEAETLYGMSLSAVWTGDVDAGERHADEARSAFEEIGAREGIGEVYMAQAFMAHRRGEHAAARPLWEASLAISREVGNHILATTQLVGIAICAFHARETEEAVQIAIEALNNATGQQNIPIASWILDFIAAFAVSVAPEEAVRLAGAVDSIRQEAGGGMELEPLEIEDARTVASRLLDPDDLERAWTEGRTMTLEQAVDYAREIERLVSSQPGP
jgi:predicted ATPase/DNA-binding SARP family transcriptional activator